MTQVSYRTFWLSWAETCPLEKVQIVSASESFAAGSASIRELEINLKDIQWFNYVFCGAKAVEELFSRKLSRGLNLYVSGNIPMGSGLSSSSALVVCAALCFLQSEGLAEKTSRKELSDACAKAERHIGTQGGGMDQGRLDKYFPREKLVILDHRRQPYISLFAC